ncbi:unnamed protein product, partial [Meganyctiphanes norvegica]
ISGGMAGPYIAGRSLTLICIAKHGNPLPNVTWWRGDILLDADEEESRGSTVRNELTIPVLTWAWNNITLKCRASNDYPGEAVSVNITIAVIALPGSVLITGSGVGREGKELRLHCTSEGSKPAATLNWALDDIPVHAFKENTQYGGVTTSTLVMTLKREDEGREVTCTAANPMKSELNIRNKTKLVVNYPPTVEASLGQTISTEHLKEGDDVYFTCDADANPPVTSIKWFLEDREQVQNMSGGVIFSEQTLVLQRVRVSQMGSYRCSAENTLGTSKSDPVDLVLQYSPTCRTAPTTYFIYDKPINITCRVAANPPVTSVQWRWNGSYDAIATQPVLGAESMAASQITVFPSTYQEDRGLACWATNSIGKQKEPCSFNIKVAQVGAPLSFCRKANITASSLSLSCDHPSNLSLTTIYRAEVYLDNGTLFANVTSSLPSFNVSGLDAGTSYQIKVFVSQGPVTSEPFLVEAYTFRDKKRNKESASDISSVVWGSIGGVTVTLVVLVIALWVHCVVLRRKGRLRTNQDSSLSKLHDGNTEHLATNSEDGEDLLELVAGEVATKKEKPESVRGRRKTPGEEIKQAADDTGEKECTSEQEMVLDQQGSSTLDRRNSLSRFSFTLYTRHLDDSPTSSQDPETPYRDRGHYYNTISTVDTLQQQKDPSSQPFTDTLRRQREPPLSQAIIPAVDTLLQQKDPTSQPFTETLIRPRESPLSQAVPALALCSDSSVGRSFNIVHGSTRVSSYPPGESMTSSVLQTSQQKRPYSIGPGMTQYTQGTLAGSGISHSFRSDQSLEGHCLEEGESIV